MRSIKLSRLIALGQKSRYLLDARQGWQIHTEHTILPNISLLLGYLTELNFKVTLQAAYGLRAIQERLAKAEPKAKQSVSEASELRDCMKKLRHTLDAEASTMEAYVLSEKRIDTKRLTRRVDSLLAPETFARLPGIAQHDLREGGKCIAFELPTAGAFHLLRATEDTLRSYYAVFFKKVPEKAAWGLLISRLRGKRTKPKPNETLLNHLDHIRASFRNPTDHPEMIYDNDGVQDLFYVVADVLNRMAKELPEVADGLWLSTVPLVKHTIIPEPIPPIEEPALPEPETPPTDTTPKKD